MATGYPLICRHKSCVLAHHSVRSRGGQGHSCYLRDVLSVIKHPNTSQCGSFRPSSRGRRKAVIANRHALVQSKHCGISGPVAQQSKVQSLAKLPSHVWYCPKVFLRLKTSFLNHHQALLTWTTWQQAGNTKFC